MTESVETKALALGISTILTLAGGTVVFVTLIYPAIRAHRARSWPEIPCVIVECSVREKTPQIRYRYEVNGIPYHGDRVHFGAVADLPGDGDPLHPPYPFGMKTTCHLNPKDPEDSVLVPVVGGATMKLVGGFSAVIFLIPFTTFCIAWSRFLRGRQISAPRRPDEDT